MISVEEALKVQFYDLDPMGVVWHGNYPRFLEQGRIALLDKIGFGYEAMSASGFLWPIVDMRLRYVLPIRYSQQLSITAKLVEYVNRLRITYAIRDSHSNSVVTKAETTQLAVSAETGELSFECPPCLTDKVRSAL